MRIKIDLDAQATEKLIEAAVAERRPVPWQAEVLLRRALGLQDPVPTEPPAEHRVEVA